MKYQCRQYDFNWVGTSNIFGKVREHEKTYLENNKSKTLRVKIK